MNEAGFELESQEDRQIFFNKEDSGLVVHKRWQIELNFDENDKVIEYKVYFGLIGL